VNRLVRSVGAARRVRRAAAVLFPVLALSLVALAFVGRDMQDLIQRATGTAPLVNHVAGFFVLSLSGLAAVGCERRAAARMALGLVGLGIAIEGGQYFVAHRQASLLDALASAGGVFLAVLVCRAAAFLWRMRRP
jgi:hypothetical protein